MKEGVQAEGGPFTLFGGEPLLVPEQDLEELWSWGLSQYGRNSVQTNGTLINDEHIRMFKKYKVHVGISLDGPGELNDARWHGNLEKTRQSTAKAERAIERLCHEGLAPSIIVTLHRGNAVGEMLPVLYDWICYLEEIGIRWVRLHLLESESPVIRLKYSLSIEENIHALVGFATLQKKLRWLTFDLFADMRRMLLGQDSSTTCIWNGCDPYTTRAVRGVEGHGQRSNCGRTNKDGIDFVKAGRPGFERYLALYATPQEMGGCKGCRFFLMCKGQCPGTAMDGDWRNRTEHCEVWKTLYARTESELVAEGKEPISLSPNRTNIEFQLLDAWEHGQTTTMAKVIGTQKVPQPAALFDWRTEFSGLRQELREALRNGTELGTRRTS
jgi:uncharacterized protein